MELLLNTGRDNTIIANNIKSTEIGVQLWERKSQPDNWGLAKSKNVSSRNYTVASNVFSSVEYPLKISSSELILISQNNKI